MGQEDFSIERAREIVAALKKGQSRDQLPLIIPQWLHDEFVEKYGKPPANTVVGTHVKWGS